MKKTAKTAAKKTVKKKTTAKKVNKPTVKKKVTVKKTAKPNVKKKVTAKKKTIKTEYQVKKGTTFVKCSYPTYLKHKKEGSAVRKRKSGTVTWKNN